MPWYLYWLAPVVLLFDEDDHAVGYMKQLTVLGFIYLIGLFCNWNYFITYPLPDFLEHFPQGEGTILGVGLIFILAVLTYALWKWEFDRRERKFKIIREAEARGELII